MRKQAFRHLELLQLPLLLISIVGALSIWPAWISVADRNQIRIKRNLSIDTLRLDSLEQELGKLERRIEDWKSAP